MKMDYTTKNGASCAVFSEWVIRLAMNISFAIPVFIIVIALIVMLGTMSTSNVAVRAVSGMLCIVTTIPVSVS